VPARHSFLLVAVLAGIVAGIAHGAAQDSASDKLYRIRDGKVDARTYNGFRSYNAVCSHCHGPDGVGSTFAPSLVEGIPDIGTFRGVVRNGVVRGGSVMKGFGGDPNVVPYIDDIYAYLQARNDGALGRGRPMKQDESLIPPW
jgi:mono/diheme cytochrome c family protein